MNAVEAVGSGITINSAPADLVAVEDEIEAKLDLDLSERSTRERQS